MKTSGLWPVASALVLLIGGSVAVEISARHREVEVLRVHITDNASESSDAEATELGADTDEVLDERHQLARQLAKRREFPHAIKLYERLLAEHGEVAMLRAEYAHWLFRTGRTEDARQHLTRALEALPGDPRIQLELGFVLQELGQIDDAEVEFRQALEARPNHSRTRVALAELLREQGEYAEAVSVVAPAAASGSNEERARGLTLLGRCHMALGEHTKARRLLKEAVERAPASVNTWVRATHAFLDSTDDEDVELALEHALRAVKLAPEVAVAYRVLARVHERRNAFDDARSAYKQSLAFDSQSGLARRRVLRLSLELDDFKTARAQAQALIESQPTEPEHHFLLGLVEARSGRPERAVAHYQKAAQLRAGKYPEAWFNCGKAYSSAGQQEKAIAAYEKAVAQRKDYAAAWNNIGRLRADRGETDAAELAYGEALAISPNYGLAWHNLGLLFYKQRRYEDATRAYERAVELRPNDRSLMLKLAITQRKSGDPKRAIATYGRLLKTHPRYATGWFNLGVAQAAAGDLEAAKAAYEAALANAPEHSGALKNLGYTEARLGQTGAARVHLDQALDLDPADEDTRLKLAELHLLAADRQACQAEAGRVLAKNRDNSDARAMLARCEM